MWSRYSQFCPTLAARWPPMAILRACLLPLCQGWARRCYGIGWQDHSGAFPPHDQPVEGSRWSASQFFGEKTQPTIFLHPVKLRGVKGHSSGSSEQIAGRHRQQCPVCQLHTNWCSAVPQCSNCPTETAKLVHYFCSLTNCVVAVFATTFKNALSQQKR